MNPLTINVDIGGTWRIGLFLGTLAGAVAWIKVQPKWLGCEGKALWFYALAQCLWIVEYPAVHFGIYNTAFMATAGQTLCELLLVPVLAMSVRWRVWKWVAIVVAIETPLLWCFGESGVMGWRSLDTATIAICVPFLPTWLAAAVIVTCLRFHGSTALMILGAQALALAYREKRSWPYVAACVPVLAGAAWWHHNGPWLDGAERLAAYARFMGFWAKSWRMVVFGVGPGTFMWSSLIIDKYKVPMFLQMHSDWLQVAWELGLIGAGLMAAFWWRAVRCALNSASPRVLCGVFGAAAFGLTYHPLRFFPSAFVTALIMKTALIVKKRGVHLSAGDSPTGG